MSHPSDLTLERLPGRLAVCRLEPGSPVPAWAASPSAAPLVSIVRTSDELSVVAPEGAIPAGEATVERGWIAFAVAGPLDFGLVGILARLTGALAEAGVPVFAISTYDTDVLLVKAAREAEAVAALGRVARVR